MIYYTSRTFVAGGGGLGTSPFGSVPAGSELSSSSSIVLWSWEQLTPNSGRATLLGDVNIGSRWEDGTAMSYGSWTITSKSAGATDRLIQHIELESSEDLVHKLIIYFDGRLTTDEQYEIGFGVHGQPIVDRTSFSIDSRTDMHVLMPASLVELDDPLTNGDNLTITGALTTSFGAGGVLFENLTGSTATSTASFLGSVDIVIPQVIVQADIAIPTPSSGGISKISIGISNGSDTIVATASRIGPGGIIGNVNIVVNGTTVGGMSFPYADLEAGAQLSFSLVENIAALWTGGAFDTEFDISASIDFRSTDMSAWYPIIECEGAGSGAIATISEFSMGRLGYNYLRNITVVTDERGLAVHDGTTYYMTASCLNHSSGSGYPGYQGIFELDSLSGVLTIAGVIMNYRDGAYRCDNNGQLVLDNRGKEHLLLSSCEPVYTASAPLRMMLASHDSSEPSWLSGVHGIACQPIDTDAPSGSSGQSGPAMFFDYVESRWVMAYTNHYTLLSTDYYYPCVATSLALDPTLGGWTHLQSDAERIGYKGACVTVVNGVAYIGYGSSYDRRLYDKSLEYVGSWSDAVIDSSPEPPRPAVFQIGPNLEYVTSDDSVYSRVVAVLSSEISPIEVFGIDFAAMQFALKKPIENLESYEEFTDIANPANIGTVIVKNGDLSRDVGNDSVRKRVVRRLTTTVNSLYHAPGYGIGIDYKSALRSDFAARLSARAKAQILREPDIVSARVSVSQGSGQNRNVIGLRAAVQTTYGTEVVVTINSTGE